MTAKRGWPKGRPRSNGKNQILGCSTTIYLNEDDKLIWTLGQKAAAKQGISLSKYILNLIERDNATQEGKKQKGD